MARALLGLSGGLGWIAGVAGAVFLLPILAFAAPLAAILASLHGPFRKYRRSLVGSAALLSLAGLLFGLFTLELERLSRRMPPTGDPVVGYVATYPKVRERYQSFEVEMHSPAHGRIFVLADPGNILRYGDNIRLAGRVQEAEKRWSKPVMAFPRVAPLQSPPSGSYALRQLYAFRDANRLILKRSFSVEAGSLSSGLLLGTTEGMSEGTKNLMRSSGTTHLVALSGYNISIIVLALGILLRRFLSRREMFLGVSALICLFILMTGSEPSIVRAGAMGMIALLASATGRLYSLSHAVVFSAAVMLFFDPALLTEPGFQLSFLSLLGVAWLGPRLAGLFRRLKLWPTLSELLGTTLGAQLAVLPLVISLFGGFSVWSLPANIVILPTVPLAMLLSFLVVVFAWLLPPLAYAIAPLAEWVLDFELGAIGLFGNLSAPISLPISSWTALAYYSLLIFAIIGLPKPRLVPR